MPRWVILIGLAGVFVAGILLGPILRPDTPPTKQLTVIETKGLASSFSPRTKSDELAIETPGWSQPRNFGFLLLLLCCCFWVARRQASRALDRQSSDSSRDVLASSTSTAPLAEAPRELLQNPYSPDVVGLDFETRVQCAIEGSLRSSRVIGVVHLRLVALHHREISQEALDLVAGAISRCIRRSDCVRMSRQGMVEIYISLLPTRDDLHSIAARMARNVQELETESGLRLAYQPGCAIYPLDGYHAAELAEAARIDALSKLPVLPADAKIRDHDGPVRFYPGAAAAL